MPRTITPSMWNDATSKHPSPIGSVNSVITKIMSELVLPKSIKLPFECNPWISSDNLSGIMWLGVPNVVDSWLDDEGCWIISTSADCSSHMDSTCLRLVPSLPGDEVQYGFCPIYIDCKKKIIESAFPGGVSSADIKELCISNSPTTGFQVDRMVISATSLGNIKDTTSAGVEFRRILGRTTMSIFIEDMLRGLYSDSIATGNTIQERDRNYKDIMFLVVTRAYPRLTSPTNGADWERIRNLVGKRGCNSWGLICTQPYVCNIIMPEVLLEAVSRNLERGVPPLIPQYLTSHSWMFNGSCYDPCTGLGGDFPSSVLGAKIIAGVVNRFNCDLPGLASYWRPNENPPNEWLDGAVECMKGLDEAELSLSVVERHDLSLRECRKVPVVQSYNNKDDLSVRFSLVTALDMSNNTINRLRIEECNETGQLLPIPEAVPMSQRNAMSICPSCDEPITLQDSPGNVCGGCRTQICGDCYASGSGCQDCRVTEE